MNIWWLKQTARMKLHGIYTGAFFGQLICYVPAYLMSLAVMLLSVKTGGAPAVLVLDLICGIFIMDIFTVGYFRSLMCANNTSDAKKRYDINIVLSGFSKDYKSILKTMFSRRLRLFGWGCLVLLPMFLAVGINAFLTIIPEVSEAANMLVRFLYSPTSDMLINASEYIMQNCAYTVYIFLGAAVVSLILVIPYIRKTYMYKMIPMIMAENPQTTTAEAFAKTKEIMQGYRMRYFLLELSFVGLLIIMSLVAAIPITAIAYIAMAAAMVYINMSYLQFYLVRTGAEPELHFEDINITREDETE